MDICLLISNNCKKIHKMTSFYQNVSPYATHSQATMDAKVGQVLCGITGCYWSHYTAKRLQQQKREHGNLILRVDIPVQTKTICECRKTKKSLRVSRKWGLFLMKSSEGDRQKQRVQEKKTISQSNRSFLCEELPAKRNGAHASQVQFHLTGDRPA